jgi:hypothetical protein
MKALAIQADPKVHQQESSRKTQSGSMQGYKTFQ